jgi:hypothetical protein
MAKTLGRVIDESGPLPVDVRLYRGVSLTPEQLGLKVGSVYADPGFVSTTASRTLAGKYAKSGGTVFEIYTPAGSKALSIGTQAVIKSEQEVLMGPGSTFKVLSIKQRGNGWLVELLAGAVP